MTPIRPSRLALGALVAVLAAVAGCGDSGALRGAGATPTAVGPARLWPELPPASTAALDYGEADTETVQGITAPGDDLHKVDPVAVFRAEVARHPAEYTAVHAPYRATAQQLTYCTGKGALGGKCPILQAYYRDLTGDRKDDLVLGIRFPRNQLAVRVYAFEHHELVQIMGTADSTISVEVAGRDVIIRSPSTLPGYEYRTVWAWDPHQHAMLATRDEILRVGTPGPTPPRPSLSLSPAPSPSPSPSLSPSPSSS
ncbi:hypothetical protein OG762_30080 [Streptomyces sp. NBC_01136]|uniref:hypothetical protein n=1 Tax=unclassified Streptomyces TaxID=2593676 RepID=UPI0032529FA9|nr:hypothetical protein OG762_30080 [Streptomyces sp. NBC_01136]